MIYKMELADSVDDMIFDLLEVPIEDKDIEGTADNTTIDGNVFTDYLWLKKQFVQKWSLMCEDDYTQLRGFYTRQWENAEVPTYRLFVGENISSTDTATGNPISLTNSTDYDAPILDFEMQGNATQNGTPTPDAPIAVNTTTGENVVKIEGKNLCYETRLNGTNNILFFIDKPVSDTITFSATINVATSNNSIYLRVDDIDMGLVGTIAGSANTRQSRTLTISDEQMEAIKNGRIVYLLLYKNNAGFTLPTEVQVENGSELSDYEPYYGQALPINLGKNLLPFMSNTGTATRSGVDITVDSSYSEITLNGTCSGNTWVNLAALSGTFLQGIPAAQANAWLPLDSTKTYTLSAKVLAGTSTGSYTINAQVIASDGSGGANVLITPNSGTTSVNISGRNGIYRYWIYMPSGATFTNYKLGLQLEKGSQATSYSAYFTPIELAKIGDYQDRIYKEDGKWYIEKQVGKVVLDGSADEGWSNQTGSHTTILNLYSSMASWGIKTGTLPVLCSIASYSTNAGANNDTYANICKPNPAGTFFILDLAQSDFATFADFTTWLASNPTTVYYALATPTTTEITEQALIDQLNAIVSAYLPRGVVNISLTGTGAQGSMVLDYELIISKETIIKDTTPVRLALTDGGVINTCGCRQNVQLTMRETVQ